MFGKPKKAKELGKPRSEAERKKVNERLKRKYGYDEHFKSPEKKGESVRARSTSEQLRRAGVDEDIIRRMKGK